jgi:hypothetical protein
VPPQREDDGDELDDLSGVILTEDGAISAAEASVRDQAGTLGELTDTAALMDQAAAETAEERLGVTGQIQAGIEGAAAGLTFGGSRFLNAGDEFAAADELERQRVFAKTALAGELGGALLGAFASGGQGLGGTIARLTPRGALEAAAIRAIGRGATTGARAVRGVGFGAVEGGLDVAGNYLARVALDDDRDFSGAELGRAMLAGSLVGGVAGGIGGALTPGAIAGDLAIPGARRVLSDEHAAEVRRLLGEALPEGRRSQSAASRARVWKKTDPAELDDIASESMIARSRGSYQQLQERIASAAARTGADEVESALGSPMLRAALGSDEQATLTAKLRALAGERDEAVAAARRWAQEHAAIVGRPKNARELAEALRRIPAALDESAGPVLARFDETVTALDGELGKVRAAQAVIDGLPAEARAAAVLSPPIAGRVRGLIAGAAERVKANPIAAAALETGEKVAAAAEVAQSLGMPVPSLSKLLGRDNIMGQAVGLFLQARAGARVVGKASGKLGFKSSPVTRAARAVNAGRVRLQGAIDEGLAVATGRIRRAAAPVLTTGAVKALAGIDGVALREQAAQEALDLPSDVAALAIAQVDRVSAYLDRVRPRNPNGGTPWDRAWNPGAVAETEYARRARAALDPEWALAEAFGSSGASLEIEALRECHPDVFARARNALVTIAANDEMRESIPLPIRHALGLGFAVPMTITQLPGYGAIPTTAQRMPQGAPTWGQPSATNANPVVTAEQMDMPGRRRRS